MFAVDVCCMITVKGLFKMLSSITSLLLLAATASAAVASRKAPAGFVTTKGNVFKLDGKDFYFAGSNAYYFPFNDVSIPWFECGKLTDHK
jgi:hypothetical protein